MKYNYDIICIGLGPAGMAVSAMAAEMGLKVCAIEKHKIGGECMNVGCIPSKALIKVAEKYHNGTNRKNKELSEDLKKPFEKIQAHIDFINQHKNSKMFSRVDLKLAQGSAKFLDSHTVLVGDKKYSGKRLFIATGTSPMVPPIPGIKDVEVLTNENIFKLSEIPKSMIIIGGGAIGCEMAQAFTRLGCKCSIVHMDQHLVPVGDRQAAELVEQAFIKEGIEVYNNKKIASVYKENGEIAVETCDGVILRGEKLLVATGRRIELNSLGLEKAGVEHNKRNIIVNNNLRTSVKHIYAVGDCNGQYLLSHAAMHQGMLALMNTMLPWFSRYNFRKFPVPWTVFVEPALSQVGLTEEDLKKNHKNYETHIVRYEDFGAVIAEEIGPGFVKIHCSPWGKIYGAIIVGENSGEMINEWAMAIQNKISIRKIMMQQHSFPTMGFLTKRVAETWMMKKMQIPLLRKLIKTLY